MRGRVRGCFEKERTLGDTVKEVTTVIETLTNTTDAPTAVLDLISFFQSMFQHIATSANPAATAAQHAATIAANKDALATAVTANT